MTTPSYYTPSNPDAIDMIGYTKRVVDQLLRNNPLHNAAVSSGLMRWLGNYTGTDGGLINYLWIGEFLPADSNLPGSPPQKGVSLVRDDSRGGQAAIQMYDPAPSTGDGLRQRLIIASGDGERLIDESRQGGWRWPEENVWMGALDDDLATWPGITATASYSTIFEGRLNVTGKHVKYRIWAACTGGAQGNYRLRVEGIGGDVVSPVTAVPVNGNTVVDGTLDVSASRGNTVTIRWEAQRTNASGKCRSAVISVRNYTDA